ncbi:hypothetical protein AADZ86_03710 [Colwelliaceae bacterium BS250]
MDIRKLIEKLTGKKRQPEVNRVQVDINYTKTCVNSDKFYVNSDDELNKKEETLLR